MQHIKKHVQSSQNPIVRVAKRIGKISSSAAKVATKCTFTRVGTVAVRLKDSCFLLGDKFAFVKEKREGLSVMPYRIVRWRASTLVHLIRSSLKSYMLVS